MTVTIKNKASKKKTPVTGKAVKHYVNDPFFIKKRAAASKLLKKSGIPDTFIQKKDQADIADM